MARRLCSVLVCMVFAGKNLSVGSVRCLAGSRRCRPAVDSVRSSAGGRLGSLGRRSARFAAWPASGLGALLGRRSLGRRSAQFAPALRLAALLGQRAPPPPSAHRSLKAHHRPLPHACLCGSPRTSANPPPPTPPPHSQARRSAPDQPPPACTRFAISSMRASDASALEPSASGMGREGQGVWACRFCCPDSPSMTSPMALIMWRPSTISFGTTSSAIVWKARAPRRVVSLFPRPAPLSIARSSAGALSALLP